MDQKKCGPARQWCCFGPGFVLGVMVMMVVAMMVVDSRENGAGEHQQKQGGGEDLFHATNVAWTSEPRKCIQARAPRDARGGAAYFHCGTTPHRRGATQSPAGVN
jgi:hypothetical protein